MRTLFLFVSLICTCSCSTELKKYVVVNGGKKMTVYLDHNYDFRQIGSVWEEDDNSEYYGTWRYLDEKSQIIETTIHGKAWGNIWTATPRDTFRIDGDRLIKE
jgi:hypothetical protein